MTQDPSSLAVVETICGKLAAWKQTTRQGSMEQLEATLCESMKKVWQNTGQMDVFTGTLGDEIDAASRFRDCLTTARDHFFKCGHGERVRLCEKLATGVTDRLVTARQKHLVGDVMNHLSMFVSRPCPGTVASQIHTALSKLSGAGKVDNQPELQDLTVQVVNMLIKMQVPDNETTADNLGPEEYLPMQARHPFV